MISGYLRCLWGANVENYKLRWEYNKRWCISGVHDFCLNFMYFIILFIPHLQDLNMKDTNPNPLSLHLYLKSARTNQLDTNSLNSYTVHCFLRSPISLIIFAGQVCSPILLAKFPSPICPPKIPMAHVRSLSPKKSMPPLLPPLRLEVRLRCKSSLLKRRLRRF